MKQFKKTLALLFVALFTTIGASAADLLSPGWQELSNYTEDFSSAAVTSNKFTALPDYWAVQGTGAVWGVSSGYITCGYDQTSNTTDYLVTPKVKGEISVKARYSYWAASTSGSGYGHITVYEAVANGESFTPGTVVLDQALGDYSSFTKFTIAENAAEYKQYMIHLSGAYMDDFAASSAYINFPTVRVLTPTGITGEWTDSNPIYANSTGEGTWTGTITVKNEGNVALNPGDENFSLAVASQSTWAVTTTMTTFAIPEALAIGEEKTFDVSVPVKLVTATADGRTAIRFTTNLFTEGNTASYKQSSWFTLKTLAPKLSVKNASDSNVESYETALGLVSAPASTTFTLKSEGGSAVVLKSIQSSFENATWTVDGAAVVFPYTIAKGETKTFTLTLNNTGGQSSALTFNFGNTYDEAEYAVVSKAVSAVVADPSLYLENFDPYLTVPTGWCQPGWINEAGSNWSFKSATSSGNSNTYAENGTQAYPGKYLISPKITFTAGQTLTVSAVPGSTSTYSSNQTFLKVLYSTDRVNWNVAKVIAFADTRNAVKGYEDKFMEWGSFGGTTIAYAKAFVIDNIPAGDYYIGFESGYSKIDYIFGGVLAEVDNDFYFNSVDVAAEKGGMANYPVTVTVNYTNMNKEASKAHKVVLLNDEDVIDEQEVDAIAAYTAADPVEFTFTPHVATTLKLQAKILVEEDSYEAASAVIEKTIQAESGDVIKQVGEKTGMTNSVIGQNYNRYRTEWIMKSSDLGLANGTEITSLTLKYYNTSKDVTKKAKIYLMSTEDDVVSGTAFTAVASLTPNYSNNAYVMKQAGSNTEPAEMKFVFDNPYTYDGKNIRIVTDFNGSNYTSIYFETAAGKSLYYRADGSTDTSDSNSATSGSVVPVAYLSYSVQPKTFSGEVKKDDEGAAEGIEVVAKSKTKNVEYYATTGSDGKYTMNIYQDDMEYTLTVTKPRGYEGETSIDKGSFVNSNNFNFSRHKVSVSIGEHQYTTFYDGVYDMNIPEGWKAWTATVQGEEIIYSELSQYIPAGTGVLLYYGDITDTSIESATDEVENNVTDNVFFGYDADDTPTSSVYKYYKLQYSEEENRVGFYWGAANGAPFLCKAHKAYIGISSSSPIKMFTNLPMDDEATLIQSATEATDYKVQTTSMYNLAGQKVSTNYKGIVIKNGKKVRQ